MAITYKTVIAEAVRGYNNIQNTLSNFSDLGVPELTISGSTISNTITSSEMVSYIEKMATIKKSDGTFISGKIEYKGNNVTDNTGLWISNNSNGVYINYSSKIPKGYYPGTVTISGTSKINTATPAAVRARLYS